jgi:hypothetical protein
MSASRESQRYVELFDISKNEAVAKAPLSAIPHLPRKDERIFLPLHQPGEWAAYGRSGGVLRGGERVGGELFQGSGTDRVTLFVEQSD